MEITYLGHSCFKLKSKDGMVIVLDPFKSEVLGVPFAKDVADVVTVSHSHSGHNAVEMITGPVKRDSTFLIDKEGEYEIGGIEISAMRNYHDKKEGAEKGKNLVVSIRMDGFNFLHLGDLGQSLSESQIERIGSVDILCVNVGGSESLPLDEVSDLIKDIAPSLVIPMHYKVSGMKSEYDSLGTIENFLDKNKLPLAGEPVHKFKVEDSSLPDDTQVLIMNG